MNDSEANAIEGVKTLWPYLSMSERFEWCDTLAATILGDHNRWMEIIEMVKPDE